MLDHSCLMILAKDLVNLILGPLSLFTWKSTALELSCLRTAGLASSVFWENYYVFVAT